MPLKLFRRSKTGAYYIRGTVAGQAIFESTGCRARGQADAFRIRRETQILNRHALGTKATITFAEAALAYMQAGGENRFLHKILEYFGPDQRLADLDNARVQAAAAAIYPDAAPATINRQVITPISAVVTMAAENGQIDHRKFRRLKANRARTRWLHPMEMDAMLAAAAPHLVPILAAMVGTGCRTGEILGAQARYFHPATGEIWIPETKNGHPRMVRMPRRAVDLVLAHSRTDGALFRTPKGAPYTARTNGGGQIKAAFDGARKAAGLGDDVTPHTLRHTWATWFYAATGRYGDMLDLGGWRTSQTAERYRKLAPADLANALIASGWDFTRMGADLPAGASCGVSVLRLVT